MDRPGASDESKHSLSECTVLVMQKWAAGEATVSSCCQSKALELCAVRPPTVRQGLAVPGAGSWASQRPLQLHCCDSARNLVQGHTEECTSITVRVPASIYEESLMPPSALHGCRLAACRGKSIVLPPPTQLSPVARGCAALTGPVKPSSSFRQARPGRRSTMASAAFEASALLPPLAEMGATVDFSCLARGQSEVLTV